MEENKNDKIKLIGSIIVVIAVAVVGLLFFSGGNKAEVVVEEVVVEEQNKVYDFINVIYTDNGFVPPVVISNESRINFKNRTSEDVQIVLSENGSNSEETINVVSRGENIYEFTTGGHTATVVSTQDQINIQIKN
jgi:hypothetical protein